MVTRWFQRGFEGCSTVVFWGQIHCAIAVHMFAYLRASLLAAEKKGVGSAPVQTVSFELTLARDAISKGGLPSWPTMLGYLPACDALGCFDLNLLPMRRSAITRPCCCRLWGATNDDWL
jgi:hypothetical protein